MTFIRSIILAVCLCAGAASAAAADADLPRTVVNTAFGPGEKLVFSVDYGILNAGEAVMAVDGIEPVDGRPCYKIVTTAESNAFVSAFYKVRDRVESFIDTAGIYSRRFTKDLNEGTWWSDQEVRYDQEAHRCYTTTRTRKKTKTDTLAVPPYVQDILSVFYYTRTRQLKPGTSFDIDTQADHKVYPLRVKVLEKEKVKVPAGDFSCIKVEPVMRSSAIFKQQGRIWIWLTDDGRHLPVLVKSKIKIGSISIRLKEYAAPGAGTK